MGPTRTLLFCVLSSLLFLPLVMSKNGCFNVWQSKRYAEAANIYNCGVSKTLKHSTPTRIMGGTNAELGEFPWMAALFYRSKNETVQGCGGSLIHKKFVMTAAHCCLGDYVMELMFVRLGEYDTLTKEDCNSGRCAPKHIDVPVARIHTHEQYIPSKTKNDICLLELKKEVEFTDYIYPVCLPLDCRMQQNTFEDTKVTAAGWGRKDQVDARRVDVLQKVNLVTSARKLCGKKWKAEDPNVQIDNTQICAGYGLGKDACNGDSGGPLMFNSSLTGQPRQYAVGLVSFGQPCSHRHKSLLPGIYTNVASYIRWIFNHIAG